MKIRDSGMPDKGMWKGFFFPAQTLETLEFNSGVRDAVEFGCGYGTFTIPAARIIKGVEYQSISTDKFNTIEQAEKFMQDGGKILACGTCIKSRNQEGTEMCPINTMKDMYDIVKESDKVVTF